MCACEADIETTKHFLLRSHFYSTRRVELKDQVSFMLYVSKTNTSENLNQNIIKILIKYLKKMVVLKICYYH